MTTLDFTDKIWAFYQRLEKEFINSLNYVALTEDNYNTYSIEYEKLILSIGSEIDILCKALCNEIQRDKHPNQMPQYYAILSSIPNFMTSKVCCLKQNISFSPFAEWTDQNRPDWWNVYNKIKHDRINNNNYKKGNLKSTYYALARLYVLCRFLFRQIDSQQPYNEPLPVSQIFSMDGWQKYYPMGNGFFYCLRSNGGVGIVKGN